MGFHGTTPDLLKVIKCYCSIRNFCREHLHSLTEGKDAYNNVMRPQNLSLKALKTLSRVKPPTCMMESKGRWKQTCMCSSSRGQKASEFPVNLTRLLTRKGPQSSWLHRKCTKHQVHHTLFLLVLKNNPLLFPSP